MSANLISECSKCGIELNESTMKYHTCKKNNSMEVYNKLSYDIQELVLQKIFKKNVKEHKKELIEELNEEFWIIFDKEWIRTFYDNTLLFSICLEVMPYEVLIHKPLNCKIMNLCIKIDNVDITNLFHYDSEEPHNEHFCNIMYGTDTDFTYGDLVEILNDECNKYINFIKEDYDEDIQIGDHRFLEILELKKVENIKNMDTYQLEFFMGS